MKKLPEIPENQVSFGAYLGHPEISGSFCAFGGVLHGAEDLFFCSFPWGYRIFVLLFRLNFYKNLDFGDGVTGHVMLMSIIKIEGVICECIKDAD